MKKPEEIKKGLECCQTTVRCSICPYTDVGNIVAECSGRLAGDALEYIIQLESRLAKVERENEALRHDLKLADAIDCTCCIHNQKIIDSCDCDCNQCKEQCVCNTCRNNDKYKWRGICSENTKGE